MGDGVVEDEVKFQDDFKVDLDRDEEPRKYIDRAALFSTPAWLYQRVGDGC